MAMAGDAQGAGTGWVDDLLESAGVGVFSVEFRSGRITRCNDAFARILGYPSAAAVIGTSAFDTYADPGERAEAVARFLSDPKTRETGFVRFEARRKRADTGEVFDALISVRVIQGDDGWPSRMDCTVEDIGERKRAEKAFRLGDERFRLMFESGPIAKALIDPRGVLTRVNAVFARFVGRTESDLGTVPMRDFLHPDEAADAAALIPPADQPAAGRDWRFLRPDGSIVWGHVTAGWLHDAGEVQGALVTVQDVTARREAEEDLRKSEARYRDLFEQASDGILLLDTNAAVVAANPAFLAMTGYSIDEVRGRRTMEFYEFGRPADDSEATRAAILAGRATTARRRVVRKDGASIDAEARAKLLPDGRVLVMVRDITDAIRRDEERQNVAKIESIGVLAGGIAHDFNNLLTAILGYVQLAQESGPDASAVDSALGRAVAAVEHARKLTQQLLTFARGGEPVKRILRPAVVIRDAVGFALRGSNVVCRYEMNEEPWPIDADEGQISQVVHNLVLNAQQAMTGGGEVLVTTRNRLIDADPDLAPGPYVEVGIRDHGGGIPTDVLPRIFDPYFTTKAGGTGLGLSTSFRIVRQHRGRLGVQVHPGSGCTFTFLLPARPGVSVPAAPHHAPRRPGRGRVLVMDDEANIRELLLAVLGKEGYDVTAVRDGTGALEEWDRARQAGVPFDIVLMDLTIPGGMGGREAVRRLKALDPGARAIVSSGYSTDPVMSRYRDEGFDGVVAKPYRLDDLLFEVERVLDRRRSGARRRRSGAVPRQP